MKYIVDAWKYQPTDHDYTLDYGSKEFFSEPEAIQFANALVGNNSTSQRNYFLKYLITVASVDEEKEEFVNPLFTKYTNDEPSLIYLPE